MFVFRRPIRFAEIDAARVVFFPRFPEFCHDALEALFAGLPGGYAALTGERGFGIPTVHFAIDHRAPLRYGDVARLETEVLRIGRTSVSLRHTIWREADNVLSAEAVHVIVFGSMATLTPAPIPDDVRALFAAHQVGGAVPDFV